MKAIYAPKPQLCVVIEIYGDTVLLEPVDGTADQQFTVDLSDPSLTIDPTDAEVENVR